MVEEKIICAGFGGQGVMSLGLLLAYAAMIEGNEVTWMPSYGPEMRGGTAYCCVIIGDRPIGSPLISDDATAVIVMNQPSLEKFEQRIVSGGLLLVNSSLVGQRVARHDLDVRNLPALDEAVVCGDGRVANMIMLGALQEVTGVVRTASILQAFGKVFGAKARRLLPLNSAALARGAALIRDQAAVKAAA